MSDTKLVTVVIYWLSTRSILQTLETVVCRDERKSKCTPTKLWHKKSFTNHSPTFDESLPHFISFQLIWWNFPAFDNLLHLINLLHFINFCKVYAPLILLTAFGKGILFDKLATFDKLVPFDKLTAFDNLTHKINELHLINLPY